jgi:pimeloyl-ACP methyl ester carboxylesterase
MKRGIRFLFCLVIGGLGLIAAGCGLLASQRYGDFSVATPLPADHILILGIVGGIERWNDDSRGVPKLAAKLRGMRLPSVCVETVENHRVELAVTLIQRAFDRNGNGLLERSERESARLILFGHSMGGAAVVALAAELKQLGLPVLLTIQVDSFGRDDHWIPSNVQRAANFYQSDGALIKGETSIAATDERVTSIIGNFEFEYGDHPVDMSGQKFIRRLFNTPHDQMAADPRVWNRVEDLILAQVLSSTRDG